MAQEEKIFADGFVFKRNENAPDFVVGRLSMKVDEAIAFIKKNEKSGWTNLSIKQARSGNYYVELDTFEAKNDSSKSVSNAPKPAVSEAEAPDLPF